MSAAPESEPSKFTQPPKSCWSCRVFSGGGMLLAGAFVLVGARPLTQRTGPTLGTAMQVTFAICLAALGVVVISDPVRKVKTKT